MFRFIYFVVLVFGVDIGDLGVDSLLDIEG